jgi:hypothetical protein
MSIVVASNNVFVQQVPANAAHYVYIWNENDHCERYGPYISESLAETLWGFVDPDGDYQPPNHTVETELWELYNDAESITDSDGPIRDGDPWAF